jgi:hypothetical protein
VAVGAILGVAAIAAYGVALRRAKGKAKKVASARQRSAAATASSGSIVGDGGGGGGGGGCGGSGAGGSSCVQTACADAGQVQVVVEGRSDPWAAIMRRSAARRGGSGASRMLPSTCVVFASTAA